MNLVEIAAKAIQTYAEMHPRPSQVTQKQAAEMIGLSDRTIRNMVRYGTIKLNACGLVPISEVDRVLAVREGH